MNAGQLLGDLPQGNITKGMLHSLCPSPINACTICLSGSHIREALEQSLLDEFSGKPIVGFGFRGHILGTLCMDGIEVQYNPDAPAYEKIQTISINGEPMDEQCEYIVGTLDMFTFNVGYPPLAHGTRTLYHLPEFIRDLLETEIKTTRGSGRQLASPLASKLNLKCLPSAEAAASGNYIYGAGEDRLCV